MTEDVPGGNDDEYTSLGRSPTNTNQLRPMLSAKGHDNEAEVRFSNNAVIRTQWGMSALQRATADPSYQRCINALYISTHALDTFEEKRNHNNI